MKKTNSPNVGCAVRTEKKLQAVDSWCAWRTLQTWLYLNAMILRHIRASLEVKAVKGPAANRPLLSSQSPAAGHPGSGTQAHRILQQSAARQTSPKQD